MMDLTYERISIRDYNGKRSTILIRITSEFDAWVSGWKVLKDGDRTEYFHLIDKSAITKRVPMKMNNHYGELEIA